MYIILIIITFVGLLWIYSKNNEIEKLRKDVNQLSGWCATMDSVLKDSGLWVYDEQQEKFVANKSMRSGEDFK